MQILRNEAEQDFVTSLASHRQRLQLHVGEALGTPPGGTATSEALSRLAEGFRTAMELMKAAEERLAESHRILEQTRADRARFQYLFDRAPTALMITSSDTTIRSANRAASALLGRETSQLIGRDVTGMVHIDHLRVFRGHLAQVVSSGEAMRWSFLLRPAGRVPFLAHAAVRVVHDPMNTHRSLYWSLTAT